MLKPLLFSLLVLPLTTSGKEDYGTIVVSNIVSVYDADTFRVNVSGWPAIIGQSMPIRANGFDAPEIRGKCDLEKQLAQQARLITEQALQKAERIELRNSIRGKYFRIVADVYLDGEPLKEMHFRAGTARPYSGGKRKRWCD